MDKPINELNIDYIKLQKMAFLYNALENGWTIKKDKEVYKFTKNHQGAKEIFLITNDSCCHPNIFQFLYHMHSLHPFQCVEKNRVFPKALEIIKTSI